jgi:hypothetical protein
MKASATWECQDSPLEKPRLVGRVSRLRRSLIPGFFRSACVLGWLVARLRRLASRSTLRNPKGSARSGAE